MGKDKKETVRKTICLCMIMKNEGSIILKCLESVAPFIDYWVINDNGSTDNSVQIVTDFFKERKICGKMLYDAWVGFAYNRSIVFKEAEANSNCQWMYVIDADDHLITPLMIPKEPAFADSFIINIQEGPNIMQTRQQLFKIGFDWCYSGAVHEYPSSMKFKKDVVKVCKTTEIVVKASRGGDRSKDPLKYWKDAILMQKDLERVRAQKKLPHWEVGIEERYLYYICQSWHDFGHFDNCIKWAEERIKVNGFKEEIFRAHLMKARSLRNLKRNPEEIIEALKTCIKYDPFRAEAYFDLVEQYGKCERWKEADELVKKVVKIKKPGDKLFIVEDVIYKFAAKKEAAWIAYKLGNHEEAYKIAHKLASDLTNQDEHRVWACSIKYKQIEHLLPNRLEYKPVWKEMKGVGLSKFVVNFIVTDLVKAKKTVTSWLNCCSDKHDIDQWGYRLGTGAVKSEELETLFPFLQNTRVQGDITLNIDDSWVFFHKDLYVAELKGVEDTKIVYLNRDGQLFDQPILPLVVKGKSNLIEMKTVAKMPYAVYKDEKDSKKAGIFSFERISAIKQ